MKINHIRIVTSFRIGATLVAIAVLTLAVPLLSKSSNAAAGSMYFSPATKSVLNGDTFTVQVRANASSGSVAVVDISYPSSSLDLLAYNKDGGFFTNEAAAPVASAGHFSVTLFIPGGNAELSSDALVLSLTFKAKSGSGTGAITLDGTSKIYSNGVNVITVGNGTTVTFTSPPAPTPSAPIISSFVASPSSIVVGGTSKLTWAVSNSVGCSVTPDGPTNTTALSWATGAINATGVINYTLTCKNSAGTTVSKSTPVTIATAASTAAKSTTSTNTSPTSSTSTTSASNTTPTVKGTDTYTPPVALAPALDPATGLVESNVLVIKDSSGKLLPNAEVIITTKNYTKTFKTDENARVIISGVPAGSVTMVVKSNGKQVAKQDITLVAGVQDTAQEITLAKQSISATQPLLFPGAIAAAAVLLLVSAVLIIIKRRQNQAVIIPSNSVPIVGSVYSQIPPQGTNLNGDGPIIIKPSSLQDTQPIGTQQTSPTPPTQSGQSQTIDNQQ